MKRGNLIVYDNNGTIWFQSGEAQGDILPHVYPVGIPYIELPYGMMGNRVIERIDVTKTPHVPIFKDQ